MFPSADLAQLRAAQEAHMFDAAVRQVFSSSTNSLNEEVPVHTPALTETICGLDMRPGNLRHGDGYTALEYDATLRLPSSTTVDPRDWWSVTKRFGEALAVPLMFQIVGPVQRGPSGIRLMLKRVEA